jgi:hypothetical protein
MVVLQTTALPLGYGTDGESSSTLGMPLEQVQSSRILGPRLSPEMKARTRVAAMRFSSSSTWEQRWVIAGVEGPMTARPSPCGARPWQVTRRFGSQATLALSSSRRRASIAVSADARFGRSYWGGGTAQCTYGARPCAAYSALLASRLRRPLLPSPVPMFHRSRGSFDASTKR